MLHVELLPDAATEARLRADWARLEERGLPNLSRHRSSSNRPHLTVGIHPDPAPEDEEARVGGVRAALLPALPVALRVGGLTVFGSGPWVLVRTLVVTAELLAAHRAVADAMGRPAVPHVGVGEWVPHLTLARRLDADQVAAALRVLDADLDEGAFERARLWDSTRRRLTDLDPPSTRG